MAHCLLALHRLTQIIRYQLCCVQDPLKVLLETLSYLWNRLGIAEGSP